jgi:phosphoglycerate dehydrogenase-like enzyme
VSRTRGSDVTRIAVLDDYQHVAEQLGGWKRLPADTTEVVFMHDHLAGADLVDALFEFDVVCAMRERTPFDRALISRLPRLKLIVSAGASNAAIDVGAGREHGVVVCGTESPHGYATAELTVSMMLSLARNLVPEVENMRSGEWQAGLGRELRGRTLGVIGLGKLGSHVSRVGVALGMSVQAWSPNLTVQHAVEEGAVATSLDALLSTSDVVTIHVKLAPSSRGLIGVREIALMRPDAVLINTSRSAILDTDAALDALLGERLGGLALDVYDEEPLPRDSPLRRAHPRLITTAHVGFVTRENYTQFYMQMCEDVEAWLAGRPIRVMEP